MNKVLAVLKRDNWASGDGQRELGPFILRFRTPVLGANETEDYIHQLLVVWPYAEENTGALPDNEDSNQMGNFEDRLCDAWERDGLAILTAVLTFDGARQWVFYTRDVSECGERLNAMPQEAKPYPIELTTERDPSWTYLREQILKPINWREHQEEWKRQLEEGNKLNII